jgi:hypothetical protein
MAEQANTHQKDELQSHVVKQTWIESLPSLLMDRR